MLIVYPFAFLTGAFGFNVASRVSRDGDMHTVSHYLIPAGIATGLLAAVPGAMDYFGSVPPKSSGKDRATKHALLNVTAMGLFAASWLMGRANPAPSANAGRLPLFLQGIGTVVMSVAGYMGGTLVYRNQIGVDHRYANAGKWQEEQRAHAGGPALVSAAAALDVNQMKLVHAGGERIVVARTEDGCAAFQDRCTHKGGPLSDGALIAGTVQCPWHGSQFDVHTGEVKCGPAEEKIHAYPVDTSAPHTISRA